MRLCLHSLPDSHLGLGCIMYSPSIMYLRMPWFFPRMRTALRAWNHIYGGPSQVMVLGRLRRY